MGGFESRFLEFDGAELRPPPQDPGGGSGSGDQRFGGRNPICARYSRSAKLAPCSVSGGSAPSATATPLACRQRSAHMPGFAPGGDITTSPNGCSPVASSFTISMPAVSITATLFSPLTVA